MAMSEISQNSADKYRALWQAWKGWLLLREQNWDTVIGPQIQEFLNGPAPGRGGRRQALNSERMSSYTRQRYWRLLRGVYATAVQNGVLPYSPVLEVPQANRPTISQRDRQSQVLEPPLLDLLRDPATLRSSLVVKTEADWWHVRDRAIVALLADTGITTAELIALRGVDFRPRGLSLVETAKSGAAAELATGMEITVVDTDDSLGRSLPISETIVSLINEWVVKRKMLLSERGLRQSSLTTEVAVRPTHPDQMPLFLARRARAADSELPEMQAVTVYYTVSQTLKALRRTLHNTVTVVTPGITGQEPYVAKGAAVIRNSVLRQWLDTVGPDETVKRAGLKNAESLRLNI